MDKVPRHKREQRAAQRERSATLLVSHCVYEGCEVEGDACFP